MEPARLRILHVTPALTQGGAERVLAELCAGGGDRAEHEVLSLTAGAPFFDMGGARVESLGLSRGRLSLGALRRAAAVARARRPDVVQGWLYHGSLLASLLPRRPGARLLWAIHNTSLPPGETRLATRLIARGLAPLSRVLPERIVYCAEAARALHEAMGYARPRGVVIPNGVDLGRFAFDASARAGLRERLGVAEGVPLVGAAARFAPQKDFPNLLAAVARVDGARLALAGDGCGAGNAELAAMIAASGMGQRTHLLGPLGDLRPFLSAIDALAIASAFGEALPMSGLEAAANGAPVAATRLGDVAELALDESHLCAPRDPEALAGALRAALAAGRGPGAANAAREDRLRRRHSLQGMLDSYRALYGA